MTPYVRRHPRQRLALPAMLVVGSERRAATLVDLSRGGAGLHTQDESAGLFASEPIRIRIDLPTGGPLELRGRLVRVHFEGGARYGVSFESLPESALNRIESLTLPAQSRRERALSRSRSVLARGSPGAADPKPPGDARLRKPEASFGGALLESLAGRREALAAVVHELRRPITTVLGWATLLRERKLDPEKTARALMSIEEAARALDRRTGDLFDLSRLMLGRLTLDRRPTDVRALVLQMAHEAEPALRSKNLRLTMRLDRPGRLLLADPDRLGQAVGNLLSNAVKFTADGGRIRLRLRDERGRGCRIVVSDTGVGIPSKVIGRLFRPFMRGHAGYPGLGLGLSLARSVCELHGGVLEAASPGEGRGATFTIRLPYAPAKRRIPPAHLRGLSAVP